MKGLIYRDALVWYRRYLRIPLFILIPGSIVAAATLKFWGYAFVVLIIMLLGLITSETMFQIDEKENRDKYLHTLPISSSKIVGARYIVFLAFPIVCLLCSLMFGALFGLIFGDQPLGAYFILPLFLFSLLIAALFISLPANYKDRKTAQQIMLLTSPATIAFVKLEEMGIFSSVPAGVTVFLAVAALIGGPILSFRLSVRFFNKKAIY